MSFTDRLRDIGHRILGRQESEWTCDGGRLTLVGPAVPEGLGDRIDHILAAQEALAPATPQAERYALALLRYTPEPAMEFMRRQYAEELGIKRDRHGEPAGKLVLRYDQVLDDDARRLAERRRLQWRLLVAVILSGGGVAGCVEGVRAVSTWRTLGASLGWPAKRVADLCGVDDLTDAETVRACLHLEHRTKDKAAPGGSVLGYALERRAR